MTANTRKDESDRVYFDACYGESEVWHILGERFEVFGRKGCFYQLT